MYLTQGALRQLKSDIVSLLNEYTAGEVYRIGDTATSVAEEAAELAEVRTEVFQRIRAFEALIGEFDDVVLHVILPPFIRSTEEDE